MMGGDKNIHKGLVCVMCDGQITGTAPVCYLSKDQIDKHRKRLSVQSYNEYFGGEMDPVLAKQYEVDEDDLSGLFRRQGHTEKKRVILLLVHIATLA